MPRKEREKGKRGERELASLLKKILGLPFRRTQQFNGDGESDVVCEDLPGISWECKRTEKLSLYEAMEQAKGDAGDKIPVVCHRRNGKEWLVIIPADHLHEFCLQISRRIDNGIFSVRQDG